MKSTVKEPNPYLVDEFRVLTPDDWHPNFPGDEVRVSVYWHENGIGRSKVPWGRICVGGADDTRMELDFADRDEMMRLLPLIKGCGSMSKRDFLDMGFQYA